MIAAATTRGWRKPLTHTARALSSKSQNVAVCLTDPRDGNQSNNAASTAPLHMMQLSVQLNELLAPGVKAAKESGGPMPFLQTTGGTIFMFDLWKRGVNPFTTIKEHFEVTKDVPTSWLNRNICLNGMEPYSRDVVREHFRLIKEAKIAAGNTQPYIMQSFCAQNDLKNLAVTFEEWKALGDDFHCMPFFSFAKTAWDPCDFNPERTGAWFREVASSGLADLYGLKQPEGDMTLTYARCHAQAARSEVGDKQLHLHTQGNHNLGQAIILGAVEGGVDSVDSSFTFGGRAGQEDSFAIRYLLESEGYNINQWEDDKAIHIWEQQLEKHYPGIQNYWRADPIRANIAGGQRSILQAELDGLRQGDRMPQIFDINLTMRCFGGGGVAVTPLADIYARNTLLWVKTLPTIERSVAEMLRQSPPNSPIVNDYVRGLDAAMTPDYAKLLLGHNGAHPCPPNSVLLSSALKWMLADYVGQNKDSQVAAFAGAGASNMDQLHEIAESLAANALIELREQQIIDRIAELEKCQANPEFSAMLTTELKLSKQTNYSGEPVRTIQDRIDIYKHELAEGQKKAAGLWLSVGLSEYTEFLKTQEMNQNAKDLIANKYPEVCASIDMSELLTCFSFIGPKTTSMQELIPENTMDESHEYLEKLNSDWVLGLSEDKICEWSVIHAKFKKHPLRIFQRYWRHEIGLEKVFNNLSTDPAEIVKFAPLNFADAARLPLLYDDLLQCVNNEAPQLVEQLEGIFAEKVFWEARIKQAGNMGSSQANVEALTAKAAQCDQKIGQMHGELLPALQTVVSASRGKFDLSRLQVSENPNPMLSAEGEAASAWGMLQQKVMQETLNGTQFAPSDMLDLQ
jgi:pyruvate/oxaloacetate carboxyltransferase